MTEENTNNFISDDIKIFFREIGNLNKNSLSGFKESYEETDISPLLNCKYFDITSLNKQKLRIRPYQ